jgi:hypothetical protein
MSEELEYERVASLGSFNHLLGHKDQLLRDVCVCVCVCVRERERQREREMEGRREGEREREKGRRE